MDVRFPFRNLEPTFFAGLLDDPLLLSAKARIAEDFPQERL